MLKAQNPSSERCVQGLSFLAISIFNKHEQTVLFFAGSEALGWVEQQDAVLHPCGGGSGMLRPKGSTPVQRDGERDGEGSAGAWLELLVSSCREPLG